MAINNVIIEGRLTRDPEIRVAESGASIAKFSVAVDRDIPSRDGDKKADFINCIAFNKTAEFIEKWFTKGKGIAVIGRIQTGSYQNKDGVTVYTTEVVADRVTFPIGGKQEKKGETEEQVSLPPEGFEQIDEDDIPF